MTKVLFLFFFSFLLSCGKSSDSPKSTRQDSRDYSLDRESDKVITISDIAHVPMNFISQELTLTFDPVAQTVKGHSKIAFNLSTAGKPYFELQGTLSNIEIDSQSTTSKPITDPDGQNQSYKTINQIVSETDTHQLEFDFVLPSSRVTFSGGGVRFLTDMTDLNGKFFEYWGPVGFEEDQFAMALTLVVANSTATHFLRSNGTIQANGPKEWKINFPAYYSKSSFYVHLTNQELPSKKFSYKGLEKEIPIEVYGLTQTLVDGAVADLPGLFAELERDYGPYPHDKFLAYMNDRSGGMEYVAATITVRGSLDHELLHSWFARSMIPADGRSGWIDEAMASWRDYGYKRATSTLTRSATNLTNYSPFKKSTPSNCYTDGRALFAELDLEFKELGGLKKIMKELHVHFRHKVISNESFWKYLEERTQMDLDAFEQKYAWGNQEQVVEGAEDADSSGPDNSEGSKHPKPLTESEILRLR